MKYRFIANHQTEFRVQVMCRVLEVSPSGYYAWRERPPSRRQQADAVLTDHICDLYQRSRQTYGSPRIQADLQDMGIWVSRKRVARLMRQQGLRAR